MLNEHFAREIFEGSQTSLADKSIANLKGELS